MPIRLRKLPLLATFVSIGFLAACDQSDADKEGDKVEVIRPVKTIVVTSTLDQVTRTYPAVTLPNKEANLSFRVPGRIIELPIKASQRVAEGDVIAKLDPRDFQEDVSRIQSQLEQAQAQLSGMTSGARDEDIASLQASLDAAKAQASAMTQQASRTRSLVKRGVVARAKLDADEANARVANAQVKAAEEELKKGKKGARDEDVEAQEAAIKGLQSQLDTANDNLADTVLVAPFSGVIASREVDNFANVQAKSPIAILQMLKVIDLNFDVPGPDVTVFAGKEDQMSIVAVLDSAPDRSFKAKRAEFSTIPDAATQTYRARVTIHPDKGTRILPGMAANVTIALEDSGKSSFHLPVTAVGSSPTGDAFVWIVNDTDKTVTKRPVKAGSATGEDIIITEGLAEGETVVTAGISFLQENMAVRPITEVGE